VNCTYVSAGIDVRMLWKEITVVERAVATVLSSELSTDTANFDSGALGFNEECKSRLIPW
jgi:hypothetical protein